MRDTSKTTWLVLITVLLLPLVSMAIVPFYDTSEPRYAEIARVMAASGDWITPWFSPGKPFWGKPPLSFWAQALSMKAFGPSEFAARLPSWLCLLATNGILLAGLRTLYKPRLACTSIIIYSSCALVYMSSGAVLTDPFLALGTTLCLVSFAVVAQGSKNTSQQALSQPDALPQRRRVSGWSYGFFVGLAIGLLAKGPLATVLSFVPILIWYVSKRKTTFLMKALPWRSGLALALALSLPWYFLAEAKTPGFLDYFIVGEHIRRFLDPGWAGDLYGSAHKRPFGTIWFYWLIASFPWGLMMMAALLGTLRCARLRTAARAVANDPLFSYWLAGALFTPFFFTFSANILWTYILPSLAGFSVLTALFMDEIQTRLNISRHTLTTAIIVPGAILALSLAVWVNPDLRGTERGFIHYVKQSPLPLYYVSELPFSAQFYSAGQAAQVTPEQLRGMIACGSPFYLAIPKDKHATIDGMLSMPSTTLKTNKRHVLVKILPSRHCGMPLARTADAGRMPPAQALPDQQKNAGSSLPATPPLEGHGEQEADPA